MIRLIWAQDKNGLIGVDNKMAWHCKEDLLYYKSLTEGKVVLLGYNNYISLMGYYKDKPLPYGKIYLLTHRDLAIDGVNVIHSLDEAMKEEELWVIGGASIYKQSLPYADELYVSLIKGDYVGDTYFPEVNYNDFILESSRETEVAIYSVYKRRK